MNELLFENTSYHVDSDILEGLFASTEDSWLDFILED